jgi:hypothetical protein
LVLFSFSSSSQHFHAGVNEWLMDRHRKGVFFRWLPIGRCDLGHGSEGVATSSGNGGARKRQKQGGDPFDAIVVFPSQRGVSKEDFSGNPCRRRILSFCAGHSAEPPCPLY